MLQLNQTNRHSEYCCTGSAGMSVQVTSSQCACLFYFLRNSYLGIIDTGSADMFDYVALYQHTCLKTSSYVCNSFTRLAGMLQCPCFKRFICYSNSQPSGMSVALATDQRSSNGCYNCTPQAGSYQPAGKIVTNICSMQIPYSGVVCCVDTLHSISIFL